MKNVSTYLLMASVIFVCIQWSSEDSANDTSKPKVNFCGTFRDRTGKEKQVENITISGMHQRIPFYHKPDRADVNPDAHRVLIDLKEVATIKLPEKDAKIETYNKRQYVEITIVSSDTQRTENTYIIELNRRIKFDELVEGTGTIQNDLSFEALGSLNLGKYYTRDNGKTSGTSPCAEEKKQEKKSSPETAN